MEANEKGVVEVIKLFLQPFFPKSTVITSLTSERLQKNLGVMVDNYGLLNEEIRKSLKEDIKTILKAELSGETSEFLGSLSGLLSHGLSDSDKCFPLFLTLFEHVFDKGLNLEMQKLLPIDDKATAPLEEQNEVATTSERSPQEQNKLKTKVEIIKTVLPKICKSDVAKRITEKLKQLEIKESTFIDHQKIIKDLISPIFSDKKELLGELVLLIGKNQEEQLKFFTNQENIKKVLDALYKTFLLGDSIDELSTELFKTIKNQDNKKEIIKKLSGLDEANDEEKNGIISRLNRIVTAKNNGKGYAEDELLDKTAERFGTNNQSEASTANQDRIGELVKKIVNYNQENSDNHKAIKAKLKSIIIEIRYPNIDKQAKLIADYTKIVTEGGEAEQKIIESLSKDKNLETGLDLILDFVKVDRTEKQKKLLTDLGLTADSKDLNVKDVIHKFLPPLAIEPIKLLVDGQYENTITIKQNIKENLDKLVQELGKQEGQQDKGKVKKGFFSGKSDITKRKEKAEKLTEKVTTLEGKELEEKIKSLCRDTGKTITQEQSTNIIKNLTQDAKKITKLEIEQTGKVKKAKLLKEKIKKACYDLQKIKDDSKIDEKTEQDIKEITELVTLDNFPQFSDFKHDKDKFENEIKNFARFLSLSSFELEEKLKLISEINSNNGDLKQQITEYHQLVSHLIGGRIAQLLPLLTQEDFSKCEADKVPDIIGQTISDIYNINVSKNTGKAIYIVITEKNTIVKLGARAITRKKITNAFSAMDTNIAQFTREIKKLEPREIIGRLFSGSLVETTKATHKIIKDQNSLKDKILTVVKMVIGRKPEVTINVLDNPPTQLRSQSCNDSEIKKDDNKSGELRRSQSLGGIPSESSLLQRGVASTQTDITEKPATVIRLTRKEFEIKPYIPMFALCALSSVMFTVNHFKNNLILFYASAAVAAIAFVTLIVKGTIDYRKSKNPEVNFVGSLTSVGEKSK